MILYITRVTAVLYEISNDIEPRYIGIRLNFVWCISCEDLDDLQIMEYYRV